MKKALIMAGGTGGHVFPALAVAQRLQGAGWQTCWLGSRGGMEVGLVQKHGIVIHALPVSGVRGGGVKRKLAAPFALVRSVWGALRVLRQERPDVVVGFGGFASGPGGVAAYLTGVPLVVHEQNAVAGVTNRLLARIASRVLVAFPAAAAQLPAAVLVGNPVRDAILATPVPAERYAGREGALRILVVGGSLGARALNETMPSALALLSKDVAVTVRHQTGRQGVDEVRGAYARVSVQAEVSPFIDDMAAAYEWADFVVCRAGALTVSELAAAGVPSVLVPYPHAVDDHQAANAQHLVAVGAARMIRQSQLNAESLAGCLHEFVDRKRLRVMAEAARSVSFGDATAAIAAICTEVAR